ncbi:MAG: hypothetical protein B5M53_01190 [Candidatus Cloacimonas sp. 4484_209]|nr:MAG: hypothetical protein B5M53_01190 [Candidatus Cloacimonas sp. 4484_209]
MLKEKVEVSLFFYVVLDICAVTASFFVSFYLRTLFFTSPVLQQAWQVKDYLWFLWIVVPLWILLLLYERAYFSLERRRLRELVFPTIRAVAEGLLVILAVLFFAKIFAKSRLFFIIFGIIDILFLIIVRWITSVIQTKLFRKPPFFHNVVIVGAGKSALRISKFFEKHSKWGIRILGFLNVKNDVKVVIPKEKMLGTYDQLSAILRSLPVDWVIFTIPFEKRELLQRGINICKQLGVLASWPISDFFPFEDANLSLEIYDGIPLINFKTTTTKKWELLLKGIFDRLFALILIVIFTPVFICVSMLVKLTSKGPVFFRQIRCGINGRKFIFYKFRTMIENAEEKKTEIAHLNIKKVVFKIENDPRVTTVGRFLRRTSIDELPQLFNVLKGDMSFVGPRPPIPEEVEKYEDWQRRRLSMKPGLTCLWQISGRAELDFDEWMRLDLEYIDTWSLILDIKILLKTIPALLTMKGAY